MHPLRVTAHLEAGLAHATSWGISLDGLLAGILHAERKADLLARGQDHTPLVDQDDPDDLDLPLQRCTLPTGTDWHWAATCSWPVDGHDLMPDVRYWSSRVDHRHIDDLAASLPQHIDEQAGRWRSHHMPVLVTTCTAVTWRCVGDPDRIHDLLQHGATAIGKKRSQGQGRVLRWEVLDDVEATTWQAGHTHPDGTLGRPVPDACLQGSEIDVDALTTARTGLRPPLSHRSRQRQLYLPQR